MADPLIINVVRGKDCGMLSFDYGNVRVETKCWWDPTNKVDAGTYTGAATRMASKKDGFDGGNREAIYLGLGVPCNDRSRTCNGIFIHKGTSAIWTVGCIVADQHEVLRIWQCINPKDQYIVSINVWDQFLDQPSDPQGWPRMGPDP